MNIHQTAVCMCDMNIHQIVVCMCDMNIHQAAVCMCDAGQWNGREVATFIGKTSNR